jgi:RHS repeat-associated protein
MEMVENDVESVTTYGPYGNLLAQTGNDEPVAGTDYGYTGEQHDASTGLLYLRARYYNPSLRSFMGRDPWSGNVKRPQSMNGWSYVENNSVNLIDLTGRQPSFPTRCRTKTSVYEYEKCVRSAYGVEAPVDSAYQVPLTPRKEFKPRHNTSGCYYGPVPYRASGYLEGVSGSLVSVVGVTAGYEMLYDFSHMERQSFVYTGVTVTDLLGLSGAVYDGYAYGFDNWATAAEDYSGWFLTGNLGVSGGPSYLNVGVRGTGGIVGFVSLPDPRLIYGGATYWGVSAGFDAVTIPLVVADVGPDLGVAATFYSAVGFPKRYYTIPDATKPGRRRLTHLSLMLNDILNGNGRLLSLRSTHRSSTKMAMITRLAVHLAGVYDSIHYYSFSQ